MKNTKNKIKYSRKYNQELDNGYCGTFTYDNKAILDKKHKRYTQDEWSKIEKEFNERMEKFHREHNRYMQESRYLASKAYVD